MIQFSSQVTKFPAFGRLLDPELLLFVHGNPTVYEALIHHGMYPPADETRVWASRWALRDPRDLKRLLWLTLFPATPPEVMLMDFATAGGGNDWLGTYHSGYITIYKPLVERWEELEALRTTGAISAEQEGVRILLWRNVVAVLLHELLHFFNDKIYPAHPLNTGLNHFPRFGLEAFGTLGWEGADYEGYEEVLKMAGVKF
jgi:hypothetical protein